MKIKDENTALFTRMLSSFDSGWRIPVCSVISEWLFSVISSYIKLLFFSHSHVPFAPRPLTFAQQFPTRRGKSTHSRTYRFVSIVHYFISQLTYSNANLQQAFVCFAYFDASGASTTCRYQRDLVVQEFNFRLSSMLEHIVSSLCVHVSTVSISVVC